MLTFSMSTKQTVSQNSNFEGSYVNYYKIKEICLQTHIYE